MRNLIGIVAIAAAALGCKKEKADSDKPERTGEALWKLAPEGTTAGVVIAAGTGGDLHRGFIAVAKSLEGHPVGARAVAEMLSDAKKEGVDPMKAGGFDSIGIDPDKALAVFWVGDDVYGIAPVGDRAAFNKQVDGTEKDGVDIVEGESACKMDGDHYRCAMTAEKLAAWKPAKEPLDAGWPEALRGSVEFYVSGALLDEAEPIAETMSQAKTLRGAMRIERGAALLRFSIDGAPKKMLATGKTPLADAAKKSNPAALLTGYGQALIDLGKAEARARLDEAGPGGVTPRKLFDALTGELVAFAPAGGEPRGFIEIGIRDPVPFKALTGLCSKAPPLAPGVEIKSTQNGCSARFGPPTTPRPFEVGIEITDNAIVAAVGEASAGREGDGPALPDYYTGKRWLGSMWLRGSVLAGAAALQTPQIRQMLSHEPQIGLGLWGYAHLSELGLGLRTDDSGIHGFVRVATTWRNPDPVVEKLEPLIARFARGDMQVAGEVSKIAKAHPKSPLATNMKLGASGGAAGAAALGALSAVAIPAFLKYKQRAQAAAGQMVVRRMELLKDQMCLCRDAACARGIDASFKSFDKDARPPLDPDASQKLQKLTAQYLECRVKLMAK